jgi:CheY-like chemotaxis protein
MDTTRLKNAWVIDDDPLQVLLLNRLLTSFNAVLAIKFFSGAKSAVETLIANKAKAEELPDVVYLDLVMSKGDGWEFLDQHKKLKSKLAKKPKIIVISSFNEAHAARLRQYPDVLHFLSKPLNKKEFEGTLESLIRSDIP